MEIEVNNVKITLTKEQLEKISKEYNNSKVFDYKDIKTFEDILDFYSVNEEKQWLLDYKGSDKHIISAQSKLKIEIVIDVINTNLNFVPDYSNSNQNKWYPWFRYDSSTKRFVFGDSNYVNTDTYSSTGVRFVLPSEEISNYIGKQFINEFNDILL